jgi:hypothetical protein
MLQFFNPSLPPTSLLPWLAGLTFLIPRGTVPRRRNTGLMPARLAMTSSLPRLPQPAPGDPALRSGSRSFGARSSRRLRLIMSLRIPLPGRCSIGAPESLPASSAQTGRCSLAALATRTLPALITPRARAPPAFLMLPTMAAPDSHTTALSPPCGVLSVLPK